MGTSTSKPGRFHGIHLLKWPETGLCDRLLLTGILSRNGRTAGVGRGIARTEAIVRRIMALVLVLMLAGCREVRVKTYAQGTTTAQGGNAILVFRDRTSMETLGIKAPVRFNHEFGVVLLMGPHNQTGYRQVIESIRANANRVRIVAFEAGPVAGGEPSRPYRTYTMWVVPNSVYRRGSQIEVVTPSGDPITSTELR